MSQENVVVVINNWQGWSVVFYHFYKPKLNVHVTDGTQFLDWVLQKQLMVAVRVNPTLNNYVSLVCKNKLKARRI